MKSVGHAFRVGIWVIAFLAICITAPGQSFTLYSASNMIPTNGAAVLNENQLPGDPVLLVIEMTNVPLSRGIRRLMRQSHMRFTIDPQLQEWWRLTDSNGRHINNPVMNFRWTNMTASAALLRLVHENHLILKEEPITLVPQIAYDRPFTAAKDSPYFNGTNVVPLIQCEDAPITVVLQNLAKTGHFNYMFDPEIQYGGTDQYGQIIREPEITVHWTNVPAEDAFATICFSHYFVVVRDPHNGVLLVRYRGHDVDFVKDDIYTNNTYPIPVIEFHDAPISEVLKGLARQAGMKCIFSPRIDTGHPADEPLVNLHWQNLTAPQAFAAVCESYDFGVIKYPVSGFIRVEPND